MRPKPPQVIVVGTSMRGGLVVIPRKPLGRTGGNPTEAIDTKPVTAIPALAGQHLIPALASKKRASNAPKAATSNSGGNKHAGRTGGDTTDAIVLAKLSHTDDETTCWKCHEKGHCCPLVSAEVKASHATRNAGRTNSNAVKDNIVVGYDFSSLSQSRSDYKRPQECNTAIQECPNYLATTPDSSSSYRRSERAANGKSNVPDGSNECSGDLHERETKTIVNSNIVVGYDFSSSPQSRSDYKRPQECNAAIQECPNYIATALDSSSSHRRSERAANGKSNFPDSSSSYCRSECAVDDDSANDKSNVSDSSSSYCRSECAVDDDSTNDKSNVSDSSSSYRRSESNINSTLHSCVFMQMEVVEVVNSSDGDSQYSDNEYDDNDSAHSASNVEFTGACRKDLQNVIIVWSMNKHFMTEQFNKFNSSVITVSGKISEEMGISIAQQSKLSCTHFMPEKQDPSIWTNVDGTIDEEKKKFVDELYKHNSGIKIVYASIKKYETDWKTMFPWIFGQLCPETQQRLMRSKDWESINEDRDPGRLMKLLQLICMHGSDSAYPVEIILNAVADYINTKQGNNSPTEFTDLVTSNMNVLNDLLEIPAGQTFFGLIPRLQRFVIEKFPDDFKFKHEDLNLQSEDVLQLVSERCEEAALGCQLTIRSNPARSDMNVEVHTNVLANNPDAFALDRATAFDQLVGYEEIKRRGCNTPTATAHDSGGNKNAGHSADSDSDNGNNDFASRYRTSGVEESVENPGVDTDDWYTDHDKDREDNISDGEDADYDDYIEDANDDYVEDDDVSLDTDNEYEQFEHTEFYLKARKEYYKAMAKANRESAPSNTNNG